MYGEEEAGQVEATIYVICHKDHVEYVRHFIENKAYGEFGTHNKDLHTKESVGLERAIRMKHIPLDDKSRHGRSVVGWICIDEDNPYMFFLDKTMFDGVRTLFELPEVPA